MAGRERHLSTTFHRGLRCRNVARIVERLRRAIMSGVMKVRAINIALFLCFLVAASCARWEQEVDEGACADGRAGCADSAKTGSTDADEGGLGSEPLPLEEDCRWQSFVLKTGAEQVPSRHFRLQVPRKLIASATDCDRSVHYGAIASGPDSQNPRVGVSLQVVALPIRSHAPPLT